MFILIANSQVENAPASKGMLLLYTIGKSDPRICRKTSSRRSFGAHALVFRLQSSLSIAAPAGASLSETEAGIWPAAPGSSSHSHAIHHRSAAR